MEVCAGGLATTLQTIVGNRFLSSNVGVEPPDRVGNRFGSPDHRLFKNAAEFGKCSSKFVCQSITVANLGKATLSLGLCADSSRTNIDRCGNISQLSLGLGKIGDTSFERPACFLAEALSDCRVPFAFGFGLIRGRAGSTAS